MSELVKDRIDFSVDEEVNGKTITKKLSVKRPSGQDGVEAQKAYSKAWNEAFASKAILRSQVPAELITRGIWSEEKEKRSVELAKSIQKDCDKIEAGGFKLSEAIDIAVAVKEKREEFNRLILEKNSIDNNTVEGQAEMARINYLISVCTVYTITDKRYYDNLADYYNKADEKATREAANRFMELVYGLDSNYEHKYPENKFLLDYKVIDKNLHFLKDGKAVDKRGEDARLINEFGQWINEAGELVDADGKPIESKVKQAPFIDDNENEIPLPSISSAE